jgi:parvulin-like peptidyl-prolyl isomerase
MLLVLATGLLGCGRAPTPPAPDVVATYAGGQVTVDQVRRVVEGELRGLQVMAGNTLQPVKPGLLTPQIYRGLVQELVLDAMVRQLVKERQLDRKESIRHALKHGEEEVALDQLHGDLHAKQIQVPEQDVLRYYEANRAQFGDRPFAEVRQEVRARLQGDREGPYVQEYLVKLREGAGVTRNDALLDVPAPPEVELRAHYDANRQEYREAERVVVEKVVVRGTGADARKKIQAAEAALRAGRPFVDVAKAHGEGGAAVSETLERAKSPGPLAEAAFALQPGETTLSIEVDGTLVIAHVRERLPARTRPFEEVRDQIRAKLAREAETRVFDANKNQTLFTVHGRRFTLGDFVQELGELPEPERAQATTPDGRRRLLDRLIDRLVLVEDATERALSSSNREDVERVRLQILEQVLHQEMVDDTVKVTEAEAREFVERDREHFQEPPRAKISYIWVRRGRTQADDDKAWAKIEAAHRRVAPGWFRRGEDFETVAREMSEHAETAAKGGAVEEWVGESQDPTAELLSHGFHEQVLTLAPGAVSPPFGYQGGYWIVKVRERTAPRHLSFAEAKTHAEAELRQRKHREQTAKMYKQLLDRAQLVIYDVVLDRLVRDQQQKKEG